MLYNTLYVPTWLIRYFDNIINPNENVAFSVSPLCTFLRVYNLTMVGLVINPVYWLSHSNLGQLKCVRPPGIIGAISAIIIGYITSVYPLLRYHKVRAICSTPGIIYMRSLALFDYILQYRITPNILYMLILVVNLYISIYMYNTVKT